MNDQVIACQCFDICSGLGLDPGPWCRYHTSDLPPPGMARFDPKESWCPSGVQANVMMIAYLVSRGEDAGGEMVRALDRVRQWVHAHRQAETHLLQGDSNDSSS